MEGISKELERNVEVVRFTGIRELKQQLRRLQRERQKSNRSVW